MKCTFEESDFRPAWRVMLPPGCADELEAWDVDGWCDRFYIRVEASASTLTMEGPFGKSSCPAVVEEEGVLFCPIRDFVGPLRKTWCDENTHILKASNDYVGTRYLCIVEYPYKFEVFDDVATAPREWDPDSFEWIEDGEDLETATQEAETADTDARAE